MRFGLLFLLSIVIAALSNPAVTLEGAKNGLQIWFFQLLPALLPFMIGSNLLLSEDVSGNLLSQEKKGTSQRLFFWFAVFMGMTFGLPIGGKIAKDLYHKKRITGREGQILLEHTNLIGPSFVGGYVLSVKLSLKHLFLPSLCVLYVPHLIALCFAIKKVSREKTVDSTFTASSDTEKAASRLKNPFQILNAAILNGFETITILGGYLILFGIFCRFLQNITFLPAVARACLLAVMEITSGINEIAMLDVSDQIKYLLSIPVLAFGGLCSTLQTRAVITDCPFSMKRYLASRMIYAVISGILGWGIWIILC